MPSFVSHDLLTTELYQQINLDDVSLDYLRTYSLGGDLCRFSKARRISHQKKQTEFILAMVNYIKDNKLSKDPKIMGFLYGHISHYLMDSIIHPLVKSVEKKCQPIKYKYRSHTLIEGYIDYYLVKEIHGIELNKYPFNKIFKGKINKNIYRMINYVYESVYGIKNVGISYILSIYAYKLLSYVFRIFSLKSLIKFSNFDKFITNNKIFTNKFHQELNALYHKSKLIILNELTQTNIYLKK